MPARYKHSIALVISCVKGSTKFAVSNGMRFGRTLDRNHQCLEKMSGADVYIGEVVQRSNGNLRDHRRDIFKEGTGKRDTVHRLTKHSNYLEETNL